MPLKFGLSLELLAFCAVVAGACFALLLSFQINRCVLSAQNSPIGCDFFSFWSASKYIQTGNLATLYDYTFFQSYQLTLYSDLEAFLPYLYPPHFIFLIKPIGYLDYPLAWTLFTLFGLIIYVISIKVILPHRAVLWPALSFPAALITCVYGQTGFITVALMSFAIVMLPKNPIISGVFVGLLTIKPQLGLLLPVALVAGRHWRCLASAAITSLILMSANTLAFGPEWPVLWLSALSRMSTWTLEGGGPLGLMPGILPQLLSSGVSSQQAWLVYGAVASSATIAVAWVWSASIPFNLKAAALTSATLIVSPYLIWYDLIWWILPIAFITADANRTGWLSGERPILVVMSLLPFLFPFTIQHPYLLSGPLALIAMFLIVVRRIISSRSPVNRRISIKPSGLNDKTPLENQAR